jgi:hypothetical protein
VDKGAVLVVAQRQHLARCLFVAGPVIALRFLGVVDNRSRLDDDFCETGINARCIDTHAPKSRAVFALCTRSLRVSSARLASRSGALIVEPPWP